MRDIIFKKRFKKEVEKIKRTRSDMSRLSKVIDLLAESKPLPPLNRDHQLIGNFIQRSPGENVTFWDFIQEIFEKSA